MLASRVFAEAARRLDHLLYSGRRDDLLDDDTFVLAEHRFDGLSSLSDLIFQLAKDVSRQAIALAHEAESQVLGADVAVTSSLSFLLGKLLDGLGSFAERSKGYMTAPPEG